MASKPALRTHIRNFYIVTVTKGSNEEAVRRSYNSMLHLTKLHPSVKLFVLSDEPYTISGVNNIVCPKDYKSREGKAKVDL